MSEEIKKMSLFDAFNQTAQTLQQAEEKAKSEKGREKIDYFRTPDEGEYAVRVLPLAPVINEDGTAEMPMGRTGFEFRLFSTFLELRQVDKKGKERKQRIPVPRANQEGIGYSVDLLDEYVRIVKDMYADDQEIIDLVTDSQSKHRISFRSQRVMYVLDMTDNPEKPKGPMLWQISNNNYKDIDVERLSVWNKEKTKAESKGKPVPGCPLCSIENAWPLTVTRTGTKFNDTKYAFKIDRGEDQSPLTEEQMQSLFDMPRIPDEIYRYSRYHMEATLEFLKQYDEIHDLEVTKDEEFLEAVEKLKGELPSDDTSHFEFNGGKENDGKSGGFEITLDSLNEAYDYIIDNNLGKDSDEWNELKEDMRQFIEDNNLDISIKYSSKVSDVLDQIAEAMENKENQPAKADDQPEKKETEEENPAPRRRKRPSDDDDEEGNDANEDDDKAEVANDEESKDEAKEEPAPRRRRRSRPSDED